MAETADYDPGDWKGHDFTAARAAYTVDAGRGYSVAVQAHVTVADCVPKSIRTTSPTPLIVVCDVTGSMGEWPGVIFSKLPYLDIEGRSYLGDRMEISFAAVGDAPSGDTYPLQVREFTSGTDLTGQLKALIIEKKGGGDDCESYELAALYYARNVAFPQATRKPIIIFIGDEGLHRWVDPTHAQKVHIDLGSASIRTEDVFRELTDKYSVYVVRKYYDRGDERVHEQWTGLIGADHVKRLDDPERVVDVIFGILAEETDKVDYFMEEIEGRQRPDQVKTVYKSLNLDPDAKDTSGKSRMFLPGDAKKSKHLAVPKSTDVTGYWDAVTPKPPTGTKPKGK